MRVLVLHSNVGPDAPPDELDTLETANAVRDALVAHGHAACLAPFNPDPQSLDRLLSGSRVEVVFNLVESVFGQGELASLAPAMLEHRHVPYTGSNAAAIALAADKPLTKRILAAAGLPTPPWSEAPLWASLEEGRSYVVKSATEDASLGLDACSVVKGRDAVRRQASRCAERHGGRWFAEAYMPGREFNIALIEEQPGRPLVLPIAEMMFENWPAEVPRLVGYTAKWEPTSHESVSTVRSFAMEGDAAFYEGMGRIACEAFQLLGLAGYARVDLRLNDCGCPMILEINPNPCLEPGAGFASAAGRAGVPYPDLVQRILLAATGS
jgi:D-alanine-D-alanine ligase